MKKEILGTNKYFISGLYNKPFFKAHSFDLNELFNNFEDIYYNRELIFREWKEEESDNDEKSNEVQFEIVEQRFWENLNYWNTYYEPLVFDEEIALECSLTPFTYNDMNLLALSGCGMNLSPRLEAYQVLAHGTIDRNSEFFSVNYKEYFECVVGKGIMVKMDTILRRGK